jgi:hypothetical protein
MAYRKRVVDAEVPRRIASMGAVVIDGPKACEKTATALIESVGDHDSTVGESGATDHLREDVLRILGEAANAEGGTCVHLKGLGMELGAQHCSPGWSPTRLRGAEGQRTPRYSKARPITSLAHSGTSDDTHCNSPCRNSATRCGLPSAELSNNSKRAALGRREAKFRKLDVYRDRIFSLGMS